MINYVDAILGKVSVHHIGRAKEDEGILNSTVPSSISNPSLMQLMLKYFLSGFKEPAFYHFSTGSSNLESSVHNLIRNSFGNLDQLHDYSVKLSKRLYNASEHPNVKSGELMVCHIEEILIDDELVDAIGIFKAETQETFLKIFEQNGVFQFDMDNGFLPGGLDKGCLILNTEQDEGYKICVIDKSGNSEAKYWTEAFLDLEERKDDYHSTTHYINLTKDFVEDRMKPLGQIDKKGEMDLMKASENFFSGQEKFNEKEYLNSIFGEEEGLIDDFDVYKKESQASRGFSLNSDFGISPAAVKKNSKVFRSVIKLDKNFHIYVHGNRSMIERGEDEYGRKFYKIYYDEEH